MLVELHKQFTGIHGWVNKSTTEEGEQLQYHIAHIDHLEAEILRLLPLLPNHGDMGIEEAAKNDLLRRPTKYVTSQYHSSRHSLIGADHLLNSNLQNVARKMPTR